MTTTPTAAEIITAEGLTWESPIEDLADALIAGFLTYAEHLGYSDPDAALDDATRWAERLIVEHAA